MIKNLNITYYYRNHHGKFKINRTISTCLFKMGAIRYAMTDLTNTYAEFIVHQLNN